MTLQEAKDQVAQKKFGLKWNVVTVRQVKGMELLMGEVAELYASSKWDEGAKSMRYEIGLSWVRCETDRNIEYRAINDTPIPEFKP